ncbi:MAG TPA: Obg family GTPase CgtA [Candidatus Saccharimonadales bacterium]|nr:Obg family GTPase CgtA [Candidatus Saccharimonadales bacterium]
MLVDRVEVTLKAGRGGDGIVSWRREKFVPKGGPDGGDGGRGGSITLHSSDNLDTLSSFRYRDIFHAADGGRGQSKKMYGAAGEDLELLVPTGTVVTDIEGKTLADFTAPDQTVLIAKGGRGGKGNVHFVSATHQHPEEFTKGEAGATLKVVMELRFIADLALIGEPNGGKSSLIAALTGVDARIGAYPFSTTQPILGVLKLGDRRLTLVDLPGLLEGAHQGKGLGDSFLKHLKRVKGLIEVVDATETIDAAEKIVLSEVEKFDPALTKLPRLLVLNKIDLLNKTEVANLKKDYPQAVLVSATEKTHLDDLKTALAKFVS